MGGKMYNNYFSINKNFQSSINLELDLNNEAKIQEYIPTTDICDVIKRYIKTILGENKDKATTLVGPYGKGKSFLLLIICYLVSKNKNSNTWINLVGNIKKIDLELYTLLLKIKEKSISLLPIIINSNYDNIKQSFQISLNDSLKRENIGEIIPNSVFDVCIDLIKKWENDPRFKNNFFLGCVEPRRINLNKLKKELSMCSYSAYKQFEELYNCVNIGLEFNPLVNNDIVKIYKDVTCQLENKNYTGVFIIFDEFSKFLESNSIDLMHDLKLIQDIAELANKSSNNNQIHLCCVTHKSLSLYYQKNKKNLIDDAFKTVEGRFKEYKFNRSINENYQLISNAIIKNDKANHLTENYIKQNSYFYELIDKTSLFSTTNNYEYIYKDCFPLNPLTAYMLIHLSELVAQNERTLFTFLSDNDKNSLNYFIKNNDKGLFNVDKLYDYFSGLFIKEEANQIRNIWYRAESILSKLEFKIEMQIIKVIAIILMINDNDKLPCCVELIALSLNVNINEIKQIIEKLIDKHYLRKNLLNDLLSFALLNSKNIDDSIDILSKTKYKNIKYSDALNAINEKKYIIPRKYNEQNKITRFFSVLFMEEQEFINIRNFDYYFENIYCDGLVINLLKQNISDNEIIDKINKVNDARIVVRWPQKTISNDFYKLIMRFVCLQSIQQNKNLDEISMEEITLLLDENRDDLKILLDSYFQKDNNYYNCITHSTSFNELLSLILEKIFNYKLIFNNELINKRVISSQYQKAVNHVIDYLINKEIEFTYSETSPESSIKYSILDYNEEHDEFKYLINDLIKSISEANGGKIKVSELMYKYSKPPFGIKKGILPIILAKVISELSDNVILYLQSKEIELNSNNLVKAIDNLNYSIIFSKSSVEQDQYLNKLMKYFNVKQDVNFRKNVLNTAEQIKKYFLGLPKVVRVSNEKNNFMNFSDNLLNYKDLFLKFNINPYEVLFSDTKKAFKSKSYVSLFNNIKELIIEIEEKISLCKNSLLIKIKSIFNINSITSIKMGIEEWINFNVQSDKLIILNDEYKVIYNCLYNQLNFDDLSSLNLICKVTVNSFIEDWDYDKTEEVETKLNQFIDTLQKAKYVKKEDQFILDEIDQNKELSSMALMLENSIVSTLEEFSDSVDNSEKIIILKEMIKRLL